MKLLLTIATLFIFSCSTPKTVIQELTKEKFLVELKKTRFLGKNFQNRYLGRKNGKLIVEKENQLTYDKILFTIDENLISEKEIKTSLE